MIFVPIYGFIGDIIGFRFVLTFDVVIMAVSITLFHQVPRFEKHLEKFPFANVTTTSSSSENSDIFAVFMFFEIFTCLYMVMTLTKVIN